VKLWRLSDKASNYKARLHDCKTALPTLRGKLRAQDGERREPDRPKAVKTVRPDYSGRARPKDSDQREGAKHQTFLLHYCPLVTYFVTSVICDAFIPVLGAIEERMLVQLPFEKSSGEYRLWQLPQLFIYNVRPCCRSRRVALAVASELTGTYRADVGVFVHDNKRLKSKAGNNHFILFINLFLPFNMIT